MTRVKRVFNVLTGLLMLIMGVLLILDPWNGLYVVVDITGLMFTLRGIRGLFYYFSMARSMVGGRSALYRGMLYLDLGIFTGVVAGVNTAYLVLYVAGLGLFTGAVDLLRAVEARRGHSPSWKFPMAYGLTNIALAVVVIVIGITQHSVTPAVIAYAIGLIYSAVVRIASAFRKTAIVYIQ